jgi:myosin heavy subunit
MQTFEEIREANEKARKEMEDAAKAAQTETTTVEEEVVEETQVETTTETETEVEQPKSLLDVITKQVETETQEEVVPEKVKKQLEQLEAEKNELAKKLTSLESDPLVKAVTAEATKEQLIAIAAELNGKDYSKSSYKDLLEAEIRAEGFEGEELAEQLEAELDKFESLLSYQKRKAEKEMREKFQATVKKGESPTLANLEAAYQEKMQGIETPEQYEKKVKAIIESDKESIKKVGESAIGTVYKGVVLTKEELNDIITKEYNPRIADAYVNEKGDFDAGRFILDKFTLRNISKMEEWIREDERKKNNIVVEAARGQARTTVTKGEVLTDAQKNLKAMGMPEHVWRNAK